MKAVSLYTDGSCKGNPGPGGWAFLLRHDAHEKTHTGGAAETTNNRMELQAVIEGLKALKTPCKVAIYTDSQYVCNGMKTWIKGWQAKNWRTANGKPVKNQDLWQDLLQAIATHEVHWHWVRGHNGHVENERVDELARAAMEKFA